MEMQLKDLVVFWMISLIKPSLLRQIGNGLEEYPRAPTSIANRSTAQSFFSMTLASGVYLFNFWECQFSIFSSQGKLIPTGLLASTTLKIREYQSSIL